MTIGSLTFAPSSGAAARWFLERAAATARLLGGSEYRNEWVRRDPCVYCYGVADTVDHIEPVSRGGPSGWDNLAAACRTCNQTRGTLPVVVYLASRSGRVGPGRGRHPEGKPYRRKSLSATIADLVAGRILGDRRTKNAPVSGANRDRR